ncbi:MAG: hypothetical protein HC904_16895, partial [Blastochloris sp.]|nr:hypothetical protein [Blastochloris sp.]
FGYFYGLGLLSTREFAPVSIRRLGQAFVLLGAVLMLLVPELAMSGSIQSASLAMGLGFGLLHLIYGVWTWLAGRRQGL